MRNSLRRQVLFVDRSCRLATDLELFLRTPAILFPYEAVSGCGREVISKRRDAVYYKDSACREKAHQSRKAQAPTLPPTVSGNKASEVVSFQMAAAGSWPYRRCKRWTLHCSHR